LTVRFCFDGAPAILMTCQLISIYFDLFWSISIISIYFDWSVLIHFNSGIKIAKLFWSYAGHFDLFWYKIEITKVKPVRHPARYPHGRMRASHSWFLHLPVCGVQILMMWRKYVLMSDIFWWNLFN
jgi:hypothetical protein